VLFNTRLSPIKIDPPEKLSIMGGIDQKNFQSSAMETLDAKKESRRKRKRPGIDPDLLVGKQNCGMGDSSV